MSIDEMNEAQLEELIITLRQNIAQLDPNSKQAEWERDELNEAEQWLAEKRSNDRQ